MMANPSSKHLVLVGAGRAHLQLMRALAQHGAANLRLTLVAPQPYYIVPALLPAYISGQCDIGALCRPIDTLVELSGATYAPGRVVALDAAGRRVQLSSGDALHYDVLCVNEEPAFERDLIEHYIPGARQNAMFVRPYAAFLQLWSQVQAMAQARPVQFALIGNDALTVELAMALTTVLSQLRGGGVTLVAGEGALLADYPPALRRRVLARLRALNITVLPEHCVRIDNGAVHLSGGGVLMCDAPLFALAAPQPHWLAEGGLQCDEEGFLVLNERLQSESHRQIFVVPEDAPLDIGPALEANMRCALDGGQLRAMPRSSEWLHLLDSGGGEAIAAFGPMSFEGSGVWRYKMRRERRLCDALFTL